MITILQLDANNIRFRIPCVDGDTSDVVDWSLTQAFPISPLIGIWCLAGHLVHDLSNVRSDIVFDDRSGVYEYAIQIGTLLADGAFYGNGHGFESVAVAMRIYADGVMTTPVIGVPIDCDVALVVQDRNTIHPVTGKICGSSHIEHKFCNDGLFITARHEYVGDNVFNVNIGYGQMLPINGPTIDRYELDGIVYTPVHDDAIHGNAQVDVVRFYSSLHRFESRLILPHGGPNLLDPSGKNVVAYGGGWGQNVLSFLEVLDRSLPNGPKSYGPFYAPAQTVPYTRAAVGSVVTNAHYLVSRRPS